MQKLLPYLEKLDMSFNYIKDIENLTVSMCHCVQTLTPPLKETFCTYCYMYTSAVFDRCKHFLSL